MHACWGDAEFPARTVDYDADSDSMDEFPAEGYSEDDLEVVEEFIEDRAAAIRDAEEDMEDEEGEPALTSTSGEGPIVEVAGLPPWWDTYHYMLSCLPTLQSRFALLYYYYCAPASNGPCCLHSAAFPLLQIRVPWLRSCVNMMDHAGASPPWK